MKTDDTETALFYAFRYALGRRTYAVSDVCHLIKKYREDLSPMTIAKIIEEIEEAKDCYALGMDMDKAEWLGLIDWLRWEKK